MGGRSFFFASGSNDGHEKKQGVLPLKGITAFILFIKKEVDAKGSPTIRLILLMGCRMATHPHFHIFY